MNNKEIFNTYDKGNKYYLTKDELKLCLIYKFGYKFPYDEIKSIWRDRYKFESMRTDFDALYDNNSIPKGISYTYFNHIINNLEQKISSEKKCAIEFQVMDEDDKGYIRLDDLKQMVLKHNIKFIQPTQLKQIFSIVDIDSDDKISLQDYRKFVQEYTSLS